jgi:uncharacterized paraquat-inducible protein A
MINNRNLSSDALVEVWALVAGGIMFLLSAAVMKILLPRLTFKKIKASVDMNVVISIYRYASIVFALVCFGKALLMFLSATS